MTDELRALVESTLGAETQEEAADLGRQAALELSALLDRYHPVTWTDENDVVRNTWSRNHFTDEIDPDPKGDPLYTTVAPVSGTEATDG